MDNSTETKQTPESRGIWNSKIGFILAAAGSAVGLGNIWKFPYICGENGGGLFVIIYLVCIFLIGIPIMIAEIMLGRGTKRSAVGAFESISGKDSGWSFIGWLGVITGFIILSYYSVVAGWTLNYTLLSFCDFYHVEVNKSVVLEQGRSYSEAPIVIEHKEAAEKIMIYFVGADGIARIAHRENDFRIVDLDKGFGVVPDVSKNLKKITYRYKIPQNPKKLSGIFGTLYTSVGINLLWHTVFMLLCIGIVYKGVSNGIEKWSRLLMPALIIILLILLVNSIFSGGFSRAVRFLLGFDFSRLKPSGVLEALGHAFFTLSLGMGAMLTYGSYLDKKSDVPASAVQISFLDTLIAIVACFVIFPIVFAFGFPPQAGPGLVFKTMPIIFSQMHGGAFLGLLFFVLLAFAALTSAISLLEVVTAYFVDELKMCRLKATIVSGSVIYIIGIFSALSESGILFPEWTQIFGLNFFDTMDFLASNWLLPLGGLFTAVYMGWIVPAKWREAEFKEGSSYQGMYNIWLFTLRFIAPTAVLIVFLQKLGFIDIDKLIG